jgi:hypothetical protein
MDAQVVLGFLGIFVTLSAGFGAIMRKLGRIEMKIETMWEWYLRQTRDDPAERRARAEWHR